MTNEEELLGRLRVWIDGIWEEVAKLFFLNHIFWEVQDIIRDNPKLQGKPNYFYDWLGDVFVYSTAMCVRRQVDIRRDSLSFLKLLRELSRDPMTIKRQSFIRRTTFQHSVLAVLPARRQQAEQIFDELVGEGSNHLERRLISRDIEELITRSRQFEEFANRYVAHRALHEMPSDKPTFADLDSYVDFIVQLLEKYYLLITGGRMQELDRGESFQAGWKDIFTMPWIVRVDGPVAD